MAEQEKNPESSEAETIVATVREAVGVFHDTKSFEAAIDELLNEGFDRSELSLLASEKAVREKLGHLYETVEELEDDPKVPRTAYVERDSVVEGKTALIGGLAYIGAVVAAAPIVATGGSLAIAIMGAALAAGSAGIFGSFVAEWIGHHRAEDIENQLERGGLLLWVAVRDEAHEQKALDILTRTGAEDVHAHDLPVTDDAERNPWHGMEIDPFLPGAKI